MYRLAFVACFILALGFMVGCSSPAIAPPPPSAPVTGKVNLDGKPMAEGNIAFNLKGQTPKIFPIKDGAFSGTAFIGKNRVEVVLEKDGPPSSMDPKVMTKINAVAPKDYDVEVSASGANPSTFEATTAR